MRFVKDGPNIPSRLLRAHEEGRVVFFCGAGISLGAGLPSFKDLLAKVEARLPVAPNSVRTRSSETGRFDIAFGLLEDQVVGGRDAVRAAVRDTLQWKKPRAVARRKHQLANHLALQQLARAPSGERRLVTTNFDQLFDEASKLSEPGFDDRWSTSVAPALPVPHGRWSSLVYLHGALGTERSLDDLVLTSGDLGRAYLTEGWAARFVVELFRNFHVCFIGYSLNDVVMGHLVDALAADRTCGVERPEVFAVAEGGDAQADEWSAKHVTLLDFAPGQFDLLSATLQGWANWYTGGRESRAGALERALGASPIAPSNLDADSLETICWALATGGNSTARQFAAKDPPLAWLDRVYSGAPSAASGAHQTDGMSPPWTPPVARSAFAGPVDAASRTSWQWLLKRVGDPELLAWVHQRGGELHKEFARDLLTELEQVRGAENSRLRELWRLACLGYLRPRESQWNELETWARTLETEGRLTLSLRAELRSILRTTLRVDLTTDFWTQSEDGLQGKRVLGAWVESSPELIHYPFYRPSLDGEVWRRSQAELLPLWTDLLMEWSELTQMEALRGGYPHQPYPRQHTHIPFPSIAPYPFPNTYFRNGGAVAFIRDAVQSCREAAPAALALEARRWSLLAFTIFKRFALYAAASVSEIPASEGLDWLLAEDGRWLWDPETRREMCRWADSRGGELGPQELGRLHEELRKGDGELTDADLRSAVSAEVRRVLLKRLLAGGVDRTLLQGWDTVPDATAGVPEIDESEELGTPLCVVSSGHRRTLPREVNALATALLDDHGQEDPRAEKDDWSDVCKERPRLATLSLLRARRMGPLPLKRLSTALWSWPPDWTRRCFHVLAREATRLIAERSIDAPFADALTVAIWNTVNSSPKGWPEAQADRVLSLAELLLDQVGIPEQEDSKLIAHRGVGTSVGRLAETVTHLLLRLPTTTDQGGRRERATQLLLTLLGRDDTVLYALAPTAAAAARLAVEPTEPLASRLLEAFDWSRGATDRSTVAWESLLCFGRVSAELMELEPFAVRFWSSALHLDQVGSLAQRGYGHLLASLGMGDAPSVSLEKLPDALRNAPSETRIAALQLAAGRLSQDGADAGGLFPLLRCWPRDHQIVTEQESAAFGRLCLASGTAFQRVFAECRDWLRSGPHSRSLLFRQGESPLPQEYPAEALAFLASIHGDSAPAERGVVRSWLERIAAADAALRTTPAFRRLEAALE